MFMPLYGVNREVGESMDENSSANLYSSDFCSGSQAGRQDIVVFEAAADSQLLDEEGDGTCPFRMAARSGRIA